jgi:AcrR family transcriptional regulator
MFVGRRYDLAVATPPAIRKTSERRTQADRREATRAALLEATVACLVEEGYAKTTTPRIAERAGVTPGALQHHFGSKSELLGETRRYLTTKAWEELLAETPSGELPPDARMEQLLDRIWELYKGPLLQAALELLVAARTDSGLRETGAKAARHTARWNDIGGQEMSPESSDVPGLASLMETVQATMRGLALLTYGNDGDPDASWPATRAHLLALHAQLPGAREEQSPRSGS